MESLRRQHNRKCHRHNIAKYQPTGQIESTPLLLDLVLDLVSDLVLDLVLDLVSDLVSVLVLEVAWDQV